MVLAGAPPDLLRVERGYLRRRCPHDHSFSVRAAPCHARLADHRLGVWACGQRAGRGLCRRRRSRMNRQGAPDVRRYLLGGGTRKAGDLRGRGPYGREGP